MKLATVLVMLLVALVLALVLGALGVAAVGAGFFRRPFMDGWDHAWDQPLKLALFTFVVFPLLYANRT